MNEKFEKLLHEFGSQLPKPEDVAARIDSCQEELTALKKLYRLAKLARDADEAREKRQR